MILCKVGDKWRSMRTAMPENPESYCRILRAVKCCVSVSHGIRSVKAVHFRHVADRKARFLPTCIYTFVACIFYNYICSTGESFPPFLCVFRSSFLRKLTDVLHNLWGKMIPAIQRHTCTYFLCFSFVPHNSSAGGQSKKNNAPTKSTEFTSDGKRR